MINSGQICASKLQRVFTLGDSEKIGDVFLVDISDIFLFFSVWGAGGREEGEGGGGNARGVGGEAPWGCLWGAVGGGGG